MTVSLHTLTQRVLALEARLADIEGGYGATLYRLDRTTTAVRLDLTKLLTAGGHTPATDDEIDAALDQQ